MDMPPDSRLSELTADIVGAYVSNNSVRPDELTSLIADVHAALVRAPSLSSALAPEPQEPAVSIRKSVTADFIVCLEDGKKFKSMKRHLRGYHDMSPAEYREKWSLRPDYPMVAPSYASARSDLAKAMGLGRKSRVESEAKGAPNRSANSRKAAAKNKGTRRSKTKEAATA
jgi:predicted transcriptional regulator